MAKEKLEFITLEEFEQELMQDPEFVEYRKAKQLQQQLLDELKQARLAQKLSQNDIALRTGMKMQNISRLERGVVTPTIDTLSRYAMALGGSIHFQPAG